MTYQELSKFVGFIGYVPFPEKEIVKSVCKRLRMNPDIETYAEGLRIYRFAPVAANNEQKLLMVQLKQGLYEAKKELWGTKKKEVINKAELNFLKSK